MGYTAAVLTVSDMGYRGQRTDTSGPALCKILEGRGYEVVYTAVVPDEAEEIRRALLHCCDRRRIALVLTTGGTGFSPRDVTPEATLSVVERLTPGIPEAMRAESMRITPRGCLSRSAAGIRGGSLIVNLPGSEKAARENLLAVLDPIGHGLDMLASQGSADCGRSAGCGQSQTAVIRAVCVSERKGERKRPVERIELVPDLGIPGDAHAGPGPRQVSLLGIESVDKLRHTGLPLPPGSFAENILCEGLRLYELPVGARLRIGSALCQVTQIGKDCHGDCAIRRAAGDCVMPREGVFVRVLEAGTARAGDAVALLTE